MLTKIFQRNLAILCALCLTTACTTSRWVTESRNESISEASARTIVPIVSLGAYPETPFLRVNLKKRLTGPIEVEEHKSEIVHEIWDPSPGNVLLGWLGVTISPVVLVISTLSGKLGKGLEFIGSSFQSAVGLNAGSKLDKRYPKVEKSTDGNGTLDVPWPSAEVKVKVDDHPGVFLRSDESGVLLIDFLKLPINLMHSTSDRHVSVSAEFGGVTAREEMPIRNATVQAWPEKQAQLAKAIAETKEREITERAREKTRKEQKAQESATAKIAEREQSKLLQKRRKGTPLAATGGIVTVYVEGPEGMQIPERPLTGEIDAGTGEVNNGVATYTLDIDVYPRSLAESCREGRVALRYNLTSLVYKNPRTGQVENFRTQTAMSLARTLSNLDGIQVQDSFEQSGYRAPNKLRIEGKIFPDGCTIGPDLNLVPVCTVAWNNVVNLECTSY